MKSKFLHQYTWATFSSKRENTLFFLFFVCIFFQRLGKTQFLISDRTVTTAPATGQPGYLNWAAWARVPTQAPHRSHTHRTRTSSPRTSPRPTSPFIRSLRTLIRTSMTRTPSIPCTPSRSRSTRAGRARGRHKRAACCTSTAACPTSCAGIIAGKCSYRPATASTRDCRTLSLSMEYLTL